MDYRDGYLEGYRQGYEAGFGEASRIAQRNRVPIVVQDMPSMVEETPKPKRRSRSARAGDKKLSKAFKEANRRMRTKSGKLRKGKSQGDIARLAHRLRKKM